MGATPFLFLTLLLPFFYFLLFFDIFFVSSVIFVLYLYRYFPIFVSF